MTEGEYTERLAHYCAAIRLEDIPKPVRERAKYVILDGLGCGLFGASLPWSMMLTDMVTGFGQGGRSVAWGTAWRVAPDHAALLNGSYVQAFELDDYHREGGLHEGANVIPAALASLDIAGATSGADLLAALILGFEVGARVGMCLGSSRMLERGWHGGSVVGTHAAAAAGGRVLGLSPEQMAHAFGIAASQSGGLMSAQFGSMVKRMHHGRAAQSGVYAAALAQKGYTGIERVFEERYGGFCTTFTATSEGFDLNQLTDDLGSRFETDRIAIKPYACNGSIHTSLDAIRAIRERHPFNSSDVQSITVRCTKATQEHVGWEYKPTSLTSAQLNLSFGIAAMIEFGDVLVDVFTEEKIRSPRLLDLTRKVLVVHEPVFDTLGARHRHHIEMTVRFNDGSVEVEEVEAALGSSAKPLPDNQIVAKYNRLAGTSLPIEQAEALKDHVLHMDELPDARVISDLLLKRG